MKLRILLFGLLLTFAATSRVSAQFMPYDSLAIDTGFYVASQTQLDSIEGIPNTTQAYMGGADAFPVQFWKGGKAVTMNSGDSLHVYWARESTDSCAMDIAFETYDFTNPAGIPTLGPTVHMIETGPLNVWNVTTVIVPGAGYNTLYLSVGINPNAGQIGADSCFLDAIVLMQGGTASVAQSAVSQQPVLANYPNPFYHASGTRVQVHTPQAGIGMLFVMDALGREVMNVPLGAISAGDENVNVALEHAGIYFIRLYVDGTPVGSALEISGE